MDGQDGKNKHIKKGSIDGKTKKKKNEGLKKNTGGFQKQKGGFKKKNHGFKKGKSHLPSRKSTKDKHGKDKHKNYKKKVPAKKQKKELTPEEKRLEFASGEAKELMLTEEAGYLCADGGKKTSEVTQTDIANAVDITSAQKYFDLNLNDFGPYRLNYTRNGRHLLLGGAKGHIAALDWQTKKLMCEINVMETCHDVKWLHIETMFAVAQKKWVYIYDNQGLELHCLKGLNSVLRMEFLPYHFLLATVSALGEIDWIDTSVGQKVAGTRLKPGRLDVMCQNPSNAVVHLGHTNGSVSLWSPNVGKPLVRMMCHNGGGVRSVCVDPTGRYMTTSGIDRYVKTWDLREYREVHRCKVGHGAASLSFSQSGLLAAGMGNIVEVYKDPRKDPITEPYLRHRCRGGVGNVQFCPFEDVLGVAHARGISSLIVPGAGEANFDALETNPYQTKKQRQQAEVKMLLEKIPSDMITLDTNILNKINEETAEEKFQKQLEAYALQPQKILFAPKFRMKGRSKATKVEQRKQGAKEEAKRDTIKSLVKEKQKRARSMQQESGRKGSVLSRFNKPKDY